MITLHTKQIKVDKETLLECLGSNLEKHRAEYKEALASFKSRLMEDLKKANRFVKKTDAANLSNFTLDIRFPISHEKDYLDVIEMLNYSVDKEITLDMNSFKAYINNEWEWKQEFDVVASMYKTGSFFKT